MNFPEDYLNSVSKKSHRDDILLFGMHGPGANAIHHFKGKVLILNGESDIHTENFNKNTFYLGPTKKESTHRIQFYYASWSAFIANNSFTRKSVFSNRPPRFLRYINSNCVRHRERAFDAIIQHVQARSVHSVAMAGGRCHGSHPELRQKTSGGWRENFAPSDFRFALAMENKKSTGYVTEKIVTAFFSGAIPIYWGTEEVYKLFNRDAFIYYDIDNPKHALDKIFHLEVNATAYAKMKAQPMLAKGALKNYFSLSDDIGGGRLKWRIRDMVLGDTKKKL